MEEFCSGNKWTVQLEKRNLADHHNGLITHRPANSTNTSTTSYSLRTVRAGGDIHEEEGDDSAKK